jgi:hypothetical protein
VLTLESQPSIFGKTKLARIITLVVIFVAAIAIRAYDITDLPLDFHPTSQLNRAILARGRYYQELPTAPEWKRELAVQMWKAEDFEVPFMDGLALILYRIAGEEIIWLPRLFASIFWVIGGLALYLLAKELTSHDGAIIGTVVYLFLPFSVIASRTFQPDPLIYALILFSWWLMYRWTKRETWGLAIGTGILGGTAILAKGLVVFIVLGGFIGLMMSIGFKKCIRKLQFWVMGIITVLPTVLFIFYGIFTNSGLGKQLSLRFFPNLWIDPTFYIRWAGKIEEIAGLAMLMLGLVGIFLFKEWKKRALIIGFWFGYGLFAFLLAYYASTHNLGLIPVIALSIAPLAELVSNRISEIHLSTFWNVTFYIVLAMGFLINIWDIRQVFHKVNYRSEVLFWENIGEVVGHNTSVVALTQDYGYRLEIWGWVKPAAYWPYTGDAAIRQLAGYAPPEFQAQFAELTDGKQYFLVTDLPELGRQPVLSEWLYAHFPIFRLGAGYVVFNLANPSGTGQ